MDGIILLLAIVVMIGGSIYLYKTRPETPVGEDEEELQEDRSVDAGSCIATGLVMLIVNGILALALAVGRFWEMNFIMFCSASLFGLIPAVLAYRKGRGFTSWWFYGWILFPVALVHSLLLSRDENTIAQREHLKKCPYPELFNEAHS